MASDNSQAPAFRRDVQQSLEPDRDAGGQAQSVVREGVSELGSAPELEDIPTANLP